MNEPWNIIEELGGEERARALLTDFYNRLFDDLLIGFLFAKSDKESLIASQLTWLTANLGDRSGTYDGQSIRAAHLHLPITSGMFDRRHTILADTLDAWSVPDRARSAWLKLDSSLRTNVVRWGTSTRDDDKGL